MIASRRLWIVLLAAGAPIWIVAAVITGVTQDTILLPTVVPLHPSAQAPRAAHGRQRSTAPGRIALLFTAASGLVGETTRVHRLP